MGEMQGLIEALFWLYTCEEQGVLQASSAVMITVDSLYVKVLVDDKFVAREHRVLATQLCHNVGSDEKVATTAHPMGTGTH